MYQDIFSVSKSNFNTNDYFKRSKKPLVKPAKNDGMWENFKRKSIASLFKYCEMTSLHGLRYFAEPDRPLYERFFWLLALALVYFGMVITITAQIKNYLSHPVLMSLNGEITPIWDIPFPAITFCSENVINPSLINLTDLIDKENKTSVETFKLYFGARFCSEYVTTLIKDVNTFMEEMNSEPLQDTETYMEVAIELGKITCQRMVKSITWQNMKLTDPCAYMQMYSSDVGLCYTFNMLPYTQLFSDELISGISKFIHDALSTIPYKFLFSDRIWSLSEGFVDKSFSESAMPWKSPGASYDNAATFVLDFLADDMEENCLFGGHGFWVAIHNPAEPPTRYQTLAYAETDMTTIFKITPQLITTSNNLVPWDPETRGCYYSHERQLQFYDTYTSHNCDIECEAHEAFNNCNCSLNFLTHKFSTPLCGIRDIECVKETIVKFTSRYKKSHLFSACNCLPACTEINYDIEFSNLPMLFDDNVGGNGTKYVKKGTLAVATFLYKTNSVRNIERVAITTKLDLIANIGGLLGLFLGFSFISVFEIFYFMTARWITDVWNHR